MTEYDNWWIEEIETPEVPTQKQNWLKRTWHKTLAIIFVLLFSGIGKAIEQKKERRKKYREVIKQGWFGEYSEWHER